MKLPDLSNRAALWDGLRSAELIRQSVVENICGISSNMREVLLDHGICEEEEIPTDKDTWKPMILKCIVKGFQDRTGIHPDALCRHSNGPRLMRLNSGGRQDIGDAVMFVLTSALVRLLGAWEVFEQRVIRALVHYCPHGELLGHPLDQCDTVVDPEVLLEERTLDGEDGSGKKRFKRTPMWNWLYKKAENREERQKMLKEVWKLNTLPKGSYTPLRMSASEYKKSLYGKRNRIAHGSMAEPMTIPEYAEAYAFVSLAMLKLSDQCSKKYRLFL